MSAKTAYDTCLHTCPCGCVILISSHYPEGLFTSWAQGCEEERWLYETIIRESTVLVNREGHISVPEPVDLCLLRALHHNHLYDALVSDGLQDMIWLIYYPFGGLPTDWRERLGKERGEL